MSLEQLSKSHRSATADLRRRLPAWLLPVGLFGGFLAVFALLFGSRLLPAMAVRTSPVVTLRSADSATVEAGSPADPSPAATVPALPTGPLLFQASGWVEPDPYAIEVPTLIDGIVNEVHILEGQKAEEGQLLATIVDDDAKLDVQEAQQRIASLEARRVAHCATIPVLEAEQEAASNKVAAEEALLAELLDTERRLTSAGRGAISELSLTKARLQVTRQRATVAETQAELPRLTARIDQVLEERTALDNAIREAETDLARKQLALDRCRIVAPVDGVVLRLHAAPGKKRMRAMDDPKSAVIVELYDPQKLQARIDVPLNEAAALGVGQAVKLTTDLLPDLELLGTVSRIVGEADIQRNTLQTKVTIHDPDPRLRPEMLVRAAFYRSGNAPAPGSTAPPQSSSSRLALYAPTAALINPSGSSAQAWVLTDGRAELRAVTLGPEERDDHRLVTEGLRSGELLVLPPHDKLKPGKRLTTK